MAMLLICKVCCLGVIDIGEDISHLYHDEAYLKRSSIALNLERQGTPFDVLMIKFLVSIESRDQGRRWMLSVGSCFV
jgi:hypothetical protein